MDVWAETSSCEVVKGRWLSLAAGLEVGAGDFELHFFLKKEFSSKGLSLRIGPPPLVSSQDTTTVISFLSSFQRILPIYKEVCTSISRFHINGRVPGTLSCITVSNTTHRKVFPLSTWRWGPVFYQLNSILYGLDVPKLIQPIPFSRYFSGFQSFAVINIHVPVVFLHMWGPLREAFLAHCLVKE